MKGYRLRGNERGSVLLFMLGTFLFLLVFGGFAIDLAFYSTARGELQRSMDAAALAGAGNLGFDDSVFGAVRLEAQKFALLNPTRANLSDDPPGAINLLDEDITLGVWDGATFTPSLDGSEVNAVKCQYATDVPTSFLGILGLNVLPVSAQAIAVANPAANPGPGCVAPIGLSGCSFTEGGSNTSQGCGVPITFTNSSGTDQGTPGGTNTAAWMNLIPKPPECDLEVDPDCTEYDFEWVDYLRNAINDMADNSCETPTTASVGDVTDTNNGMIQSVFDVLQPAFEVNYYDTNYDPMNPLTVTNSDGDEVYSGRGWEVTAAVMDTGPTCPPGAISGHLNIIGWTKLVMTQIINKGDCAVPNHYSGNPWDELCPPPNGTGTAETMPNNSKSFRAVFGYYSCDLIDSPPTPGPAPRSSIASGRKLVQ